jgi:hypothetical protein
MTAFHWMAIDRVPDASVERVSGWPQGRQRGVHRGIATHDPRHG